MAERIEVSGLLIDQKLYNFINEEALPGTDISVSQFWEGFGRLIRDLSGKNQALLEKRDQLQASIDEWEKAHRGKPRDSQAYQNFLSEIGYLEKKDLTFQLIRKMLMLKSQV